MKTVVFLQSKQKELVILERCETYPLCSCMYYIIDNGLSLVCGTVFLPTSDLTTITPSILCNIFLVPRQTWANLSYYCERMSGLVFMPFSCILEFFAFPIVLVFPFTTCCFRWLMRKTIFKVSLKLNLLLYLLFELKTFQNFWIYSVQLRFFFRIIIRTIET